MPKAERYFIKDYHYHLTHRCHNRSYLFRFAKDRDVYREMLRQCLRKYRTPLLGYCITSNHVHLLVTAMSRTRISEMMDTLEGDFAQYYNLRKKRSGAFWGGRFHAVAIEGGVHLWNCLNYIELNMVRAGVVTHPADWRWCSYGELMGYRQRYRLIDRKHLAWVLGQYPDSDQFMENYRYCIEAKIQSGQLARDPLWTEHLAVGTKSFTEQVAAQIQNRWRLESQKDKSLQETGTWILREKRVRYA